MYSITPINNEDIKEISVSVGIQGADGADGADGANGDGATILPVYVDSSLGDDLNDGARVTQAVQTLARAAELVTNNSEVRLVCGSIFRETANFTGIEGVRVIAWGGGDSPIISGSDVVTSFTPAGGDSYTFTIDLEAVETANRGYPGVFEDGRRLQEFVIGDNGITTEAEAIAAVEANPGSFYFAGPGTHSAGWEAGTKTYYLHTSNSDSPSTNGRLYEAYKRFHTIENAQESLVYFDGIDIHGGLGHPGVGNVNNCVVSRVARHANLPYGPRMKNVTTLCDQIELYGNTGFHSSLALSPNAFYENCHAVGINTSPLQAAVGFFCHTTAEDPLAKEKATAIKCSAKNFVTAVYFDDVNEVLLVDFLAENFETGILTGLTQSVNVHNSRFISRENVSTPIRRFRVEAASSLAMHGGIIDCISYRLFESFPQLGNIELYDVIAKMHVPNIQNALAALISASGDFQKIRIHRCIIAAFGDMSLDYIAIGNNPSDIEIRETLVINHRDDRKNLISGTISANNVNTPVEVIDPDASVFTIAGEKVIASEAPGELRLKHGHYIPGDQIFSAAAHSGGNTQPRAHVAVGDGVIVFASTIQAISSYTPPAHLNGVCFIGSQTFVAVGDGGVILSSTGTLSHSFSFNSVTSPTAENLMGVFGSSTIVAVGENGAIVRSTDSGASFSSVTSPTAEKLRAVTRNGTTWVAVGDNGAVLNSTDDGATWALTTLGSEDYYSAFYSASSSLFVIGGDDGVIRTSPDGATWTVRETYTGNRIRSITEKSDGIVALLYQTSPFSETLLNSTDGISWTIDSPTFPFEGLAISGSGTTDDFNDNNMIIVGEAQTVASLRHGNWNVTRLGTNPNTIGVSNDIIYRN